MELVINSSINDQIIDEEQIVKSKSSFIEANTIKVSLHHLQQDCIIPVFSKDNESTISHFEFIKKTMDVVQNLFPDFEIAEPEIRVSHQVKGRTPSAIGKPAKELLEEEKTIYYERCAFLIELSQVKELINNNLLTLSIGGVRSLNQENLYNKKSLEKFKIFIGYQNKVCTNLCVSTDGFSNEVRVGSALDLEQSIIDLAKGYDRIEHLSMMEKMSRHFITESQFAHLVGKLRMHPHLDKSEQRHKFQITLNDSQANSIVREYYKCPNFSRDKNGNINLWNLYNLFTEANKTSYIDNNIERNVNAYEFINFLGKTLQNQVPNWYLY